MASFPPPTPEHFLARYQRKMASAQSSTTNLDAGLFPEGNILEKIESQRAPGELTPVDNGSVEKFDTRKLEDETGSFQEGDGHGRESTITHRPTGIKWALIMFAFLIGLFLFALDNTIVADVQPAIVDDFQSVDKISWLATAFFMATVATVLPFGQMSMIFPAKWFYIAMVVLFEAGSALCGGAPNMNALIIGRVLAGLGATGIYTGSLFLISVNTTEEERPTYIGMTGAMWGLGTVLGPVIGGAFTNSSAGWRWAFYINLPLGALTAPVLLFLIPPFDALKGVSFWGRIKRVDWIGITLLSGSIASLVLALQFGGNEFPWNSGRVIGCFVSFGVLLIIFAFSQTLYMPGQTKERRIFPVEMLFFRTTVLLFIASGISSTTAFIVIYYVPLYFQFTQGDDALHAAVRLLPIVFTLVFGVVAGGIALTKIGYYSPFYIAGTCLGLIGAALFHTIDLNTSAGKIYGYSILVGLGAGLFSQAGYPIAQAKVPKHQLAGATGFIALGQLVAPTIALSIAGTVFINTATTGLQGLLPDTPVETIKQAITGTASTLLSQQDEVTRRAALDIIVGAISKVFILDIAAFAVGVVASFAMKFERIVISPGGGGN